MNPIEGCGRAFGDAQHCPHSTADDIAAPPLMDGAGVCREVMDMCLAKLPGLSRARCGSRPRWVTAFPHSGQALAMRFLMTKLYYVLNSTR